MQLESSDVDTSLRLPLTISATTLLATMKRLVELVERADGLYAREREKGRSRVLPPQFSSSLNVMQSHSRPDSYVAEVREVNTIPALDEPA